MDKDRNIYKVRPEDRKNPLSQEPTNNTITVHFENEDRIYDNIHYPVAFAKAIQKTEKEWVAISLNGNLWGSNPNHPKNQKQ